MGIQLDNHLRRGHPIVFGLIILFGLIEVAISAWLIAEFNEHHNNTGAAEQTQVRFILFTSAWTVIFSAQTAFLFWVSSPKLELLTGMLAHGIFLFLSWIFWVAGAAAFTQKFGGGLNCKTQDTFVYCNQLNALEGFAWVEALLFTFALVVVLSRGIISSRRGDGIHAQLV